ncbi:MAG: 2Fe-2S iron-sulfur cluster-binding protein [Ardenticatenaceae bacterium]
MQTSNRVAPQPNELIDRTRTIRFKFNGKACTAHPGDTIASALAANGVKVIGRSFKYHRPRGLQAHGHSTASIVQVGDEPSVSIWYRKVEDGMNVEAVNGWPSVDKDVMSLTRFGSRFLSVGFYYKTFIYPQRMWPYYEKMLRNIAGLGKVDINSHFEKGYDKEYLHADVVVVGGGPAGLSAAISAAKANARVLLFEDNPYLGGHLRITGEHQDQLAELIATAEQYDNLQLFTNTLVQGWFEDNWLFAVRGKRLYKVRGQTTIFATGAEEQPMIFDNNDLPGVMLGSSVQRLLNLYGVSVGQKVLVVTANDDGWELAGDLRAAGVDVVGVADQRSSGGPIAQEVSQLGIPTYWRHTIVKAHGGQSVTGAEIAPINRTSARQMLNCDLIAVSTAWAPANGLLYLSGAKMAYDETHHEFWPDHLPDGIFAAGRVMGTHDIETQIDEGELAGRYAVAYIGMGEAPLPQEKAGITRRRNGEPVRTSDLVRIEGDKDGKRFVDLDEDVTDKDVKQAIAEGYNSIELLKRYSTISMGPSQGRWSSINTIHLTSKINDWTISQTGSTTSRPPRRPIKFSNLAGQMMDPVRYTPLHDWHKKRGAQMMTAGLWMRPEHYGDPHAEVKAVRERVGLIDISTLGKIKLTGAGVPALLDKLYINNFAKLRVGRVRYGVMCTSEGIVMDDGVTARVGKQEWYMTTTSSGAGRVFEWIQWWIQSGWGEGVNVTSATEGQAAFNLAGPRSREVLAKLTDADLSNKTLPYMRMSDITVAGVPARIMRIGFTGELSYEIHVPASLGVSVWEAIMEAGKEFRIMPFGVEAQRVLRLEKAHIIIGQDTDALSDPLSADMEWAVKFDKKDFLGKRSISRIKQHGATQKLVGFKMDTAHADVVPEEGLQIVRQVGKSPKCPLGLEIIGWVTSSRYSPTLRQTIGLCWLPIAIAQKEGSRFTIRRNGELIAARVHHGAFYDPEGKLLKS